MHFRQKVVGSLLMLFVLWSMSGAVLSAAPATVDPFPIGILAPPMPSQANDSSYDDIRDMNANMIVGGNENVTKTTNEKALNLAAARGIKILIDDWGFHWKTQMLRQQWSEGGWYVRNDQRIGQTITVPSAGTGWLIERVELNMDGSSCPAGAVLSLNIFDSPAKSHVIATASQVSCPPGTTHPEFILPRNITLNSNTSYYIELTTASSVNVGLVRASTSDVYDGGQAYVNGVAQDADLAFEIRFYQMERPYNDDNTQSTDLLDDLANHYKTHPAVLGYNLWDEPSSALYAKLEDAVQRIKQNDPDHIVKVNLFPTYATASQLGLDQLAGDTVTSAQSLGQSFRTASDQHVISTVQVWLDSATFGSGEAVTLTLWDSPAKTSKLAEHTLTSVTGDWPQFVLNANVSPNTGYYWELTHNGAGDNAVGVKRSPDGANWINNGTGYKSGVAMDADLWFTINQNIEGGTYEDYVYRWASKKPDVLLYDNYPFLAASERPTYFENLEVIRRQALLNGIDFWSYIQSFSRAGYRFPNVNELRYSIYSNLAYGAKGYIYYTYMAVSGQDGLIMPNGTKHASYTAAKTVNAEVLALGPTLKSLTSQAVYHTGTLPDQTVALPANFDWQPTDTSQPLIVGAFENESGRKYVMVVNRDFTNSRSVTFALSSKPFAVTELSKTTGEEDVTNYDNMTGMLTSAFAPGEGKLYAITEAELQPEAPAWLDGQLLADQIGETSVRLSWTGIFDQDGVTGYKIYMDAQEVAAVSGDVYGYEVTGLSPETTYRFKVEAGNAADKWSADGPVLSVKTAALPEQPDTQAPVWQDGSTLTLAEVTQTSVKLTWPAAEDNLGVAGYRIYVGGNEQATVAGSVYTHSVTGLTADTSYEFAVKAFDAAGNESDRLSASGSTLPAATGGPGEGNGSGNGNGDGDGNGSGNGNSNENGNGGDRGNVDNNEGKGSGDVENGGASGGTNEPSEALVSFKDIAGHWSEAYLKQAIAKRIVSGYPDQTFKPDEVVARAEFTVMLANALKLEEATDAGLSFTDYDSIGGWAKQAVARAVKAGIVDGFEDGSFRPEADMSRAEMAVMIARALNLPLDEAAQTQFADDAEIPQWAKSAVKALAESGIVDGRGNDAFVPNGTATRAEAAVILLRMLETGK